MPKRPRLIRGRDYVITDDGQWEFTREYLLGLGQCCKNQCRFCPYKKPGLDARPFMPSPGTGVSSGDGDADAMLK
jgi:hypothetical protein